MTISEDSILLDANILVYAADETSPFHSACKTFRDRGSSGELSLFVTPQVLFEFYAVITDPRRVPRPLSAQEATEQVQSYLVDPMIGKIYQGAAAAEKVVELLRQHNIDRQEIFDVVIIATMLVNNMKKICTLDAAQQFSRFEGIEVITPK